VNTQRLDMINLISQIGYSTMSSHSEFHFIPCLFDFIPSTSMSKRPGSATEANHPPKRARKPAGFRVARSTSALQAPTGPSSSSNPTLFVTVNKRCAKLKGQTRVFSNTPEPPACSSSSLTHSDLPEPAVDIRHHDDDDTSLPLDEESPPVVESPDSKPKRQRYTKNVVSYYSGFWA
jgi:hypothetical protein